MARPERTEPGPGQESVWDYPRPPVVVPSDEHVVVRHRGRVLADTRRSLRVLETSQPPAYYLPLTDIDTTLLEPSSRSTFCEWKGAAQYFDLVVDGDVTRDAAWAYPSPTQRFAALVDHLAVYPQRLDECTVDGERVVANDGDFYGGWVTSRVVGPFKGAPGTLGW